MIYDFHLSNGFSLKVTPFLDSEERGIFSTRAPKRPNNIGLSILKIEGIKKNQILVSGIDIIDKTPVLDIKPYVSHFDQRSDVKDGWFCNKIDNKEYLSDNRFSL
ncbi:MAG: SAM-dependent methyltransferase [Methanofastidiosum sp.]